MPPGVVDPPGFGTGVPPLVRVGVDVVVWLVVGEAVAHRLGSEAQAVGGLGRERLDDGGVDPTRAGRDPESDQQVGEWIGEWL